MNDENKIINDLKIVIEEQKELNKVLDGMVRERQIKIDKAIKYCKESNVTMKSEYFKDVLKILEDNEDINETVRLIERDKMGTMERKDNIVNDLLGRVGELERTIEEIRDFLLHSSLSIEDMEKINKIIG